MHSCRLPTSYGKMSRAIAGLINRKKARGVNENALATTPPQAGPGTRRGTSLPFRHGHRGPDSARRESARSRAQRAPRVRQRTSGAGDDARYVGWDCLGTSGAGSEVRPSSNAAEPGIHGDRPRDPGALGLGATTAIFTIVNGVLLQPLAFSQPERLYVAEAIPPASAGLRRNLPVNARHFHEWRTHCRLCQDVALFQGANHTLVGAGV